MTTKMIIICAIENILYLSLVFKTTIGLPIQTRLTSKYDKVTVTPDAMSSIIPQDVGSVTNLFTTESTPPELISTLETSTTENDTSTTGSTEAYTTKDAFTAASDDVLSMSKIITKSHPVSIMPPMRTNSALSTEEKKETHTLSIHIALDDVGKGSGHSQGNKMEDEQTKIRIDNKLCPDDITISNAREIPRRLTKSETEDMQAIFIVFEKTITSPLNALRKAAKYIKETIYRGHAALLSEALDRDCAPQLGVTSHDDLLGTANAILSYLYYAYQSIEKFSQLTPQNNKTYYEDVFNGFSMSEVNGDYIRSLTRNIMYSLCFFNGLMPVNVAVQEQDAQAAWTKCDGFDSKSLALRLIALESNLKNVTAIALSRSTSTVVSHSTQRAAIDQDPQAVGK